MPDVSPVVAERAAALTAGCRSARERARVLHDHVRDAIVFGWTPLFDGASAEETLALRTGHCIPKAQLFTDLLTAAGIEARVRVATVDASVLRGLLPVPRRVTHAWTELRYSPEERWRCVDSYVIDAPLARAARARLAVEAAQGSTLRDGFGVCGAAGSSGEWDGDGDAFCQCNGAGGVEWTGVAGGPLPPGARGGAAAAAAGMGYRNPPSWALAPLTLLPRAAWEWLLNGRVQALRATQ
jgi:hypothetical protein